jgi:CheY-like chemotaxis protein
MSSGQAKIMLVEDDAETRDSLGEILELEGFRVVAFANGAEALDYLTRSPVPRLIIMDLRMPVMDGPQFRSTMLRDPRLARIPVVIATAYEPSAAARLSASKVLRKPVDVNVLLDVARQYC